MKTIQGIITSLKNDKTALVTVTRSWQHPLYKKFVKRSKAYACHYEGLKLQEGQKVVIRESKPISKTKHFVVLSIVDEQKLVKAKVDLEQELENAIEKTEKPKAKVESKPEKESAKEESQE